MPKTIVVHHSADYDGIFCREIARKFLPDAELIGWDFSDKPLETPTCDVLYVMDLPLDAPFGFKWDSEIHSQRFYKGELIWIDHHKSAIESHPKDIAGYRIDGVAACRLAWFYFTALERYKAQTTTADFTWFQGHYPWANKQDFVDRKLEEPLAVRLAGEYDIWDKRDSRVDVFQFGLRSRELTEFDWSQILSTERPKMEEIEKLVSAGHQGLLEPDGTAAPAIVLGLLKDGELLQRYQQGVDKGTMSRSFLTEFEGLKFLALNTARCNSLTFAAKDVPETGHDALMGFYYNGREWNFSLYHATHRNDLDLSQIAVKYGGGGHRGACGFRTKTIPFLT